MLKLAGYSNRLSARPGETLEFKVSSALPGPYAARLVRVTCADPNPAGMGLVEETVAAPFTGEHASRSQPVALGSSARIEADRMPRLASFTLIATIWPTTPYKGRQVVLARFDGTSGYSLAIDASGALSVEIGRQVRPPLTLACRTKVRQRQWIRAFASFDAASRTVRVGWCGIGWEGGETQEARLDAEAALETKAPVTLAAAGAPPSAHFNGKIEAPMILDRAIDPAEIASGNPARGIVAAWDLSRETPTDRVVDTGPHGLHGRLINLPTRAMTGATWSGREMCWRHAPAEYGAIHFHDDDLYDCGWQTDFSYTVPEGLRSGMYAVRLDGGGERENIPFFVLPPKGRRTADVCVLMSTFTYTVYHNHTRYEWLTNADWRKAWQDQATKWGAYAHNPGANREYGLSTYNYHTDASGIAYASWLRPMLNVRLGFVTYPDPSLRGSGLRHLPADSHILAWLEGKDIAYDVVTDDELDREGLDLIRDYRVVMTCSHPEYHTPAMLDALSAYRDQGGRLMYMGGNGFYWKVARSAAYPGAIEIRRGEGGIRAWAAESGEYYNAFDGEYGGLWRRNGRAPQKLAGVGFSAQGNFIGSYYRVKKEARAEPRVAWILDGVKDEKIGDFGYSGNGAAGFELDRVDKRLGTPEHAVVIASSEGHDPAAPWVVVPEELLTHLTTTTGDAPSKLIRADMTFFETPHNGAVFATGSITYGGSLLSNRGDNNISRVTENVLRRFLDPQARFPMPG